MSVNYNTAACNARLAAGLTAAVLGQSVDGGSGVGSLQIGTASLAGSTGVLCTLNLQKPSFSISSKVATLLGVPIPATPSANGTAALAQLCDSAGTVIISGLTVGVGSGDVQVSTTTFATSTPVSITAGTITTQ